MPFFRLKKTIFALFFLSSLSAVQKISILIPCHYSHFYLLNELLTAYRGQTLLPDEVVISLSESDEISPPAIHSLQNQPWPFKVILILNREKCTAGLNRKIAAKAVTGDLILFQDADDLPHPRRVEIVKYIFEHNLINHLVHSCVPEGNLFLEYTPESAPLLRTTFDILIHGIPCGGANFPPSSWTYLRHSKGALKRMLEIG